MRKPAFQENVTIITGATFGIGRELALQLADQGAWLVLGARNTEKLAEVSALCTQRGARVIAVPTDVSIQADCQELVKQTVQAYGRIDTLINNAGVGMSARFDNLQDLDVFEQVIRINFFGSVYCTFYALPHLKESRGRLVCINSQRGLFPSAHADAYVPSKFAMTGFFNSLRNELIGSGVSVTIIYPEWVSTGITSRSLRKDGTTSGKISQHEENSMSAETCAQMIIRAAEKRRREVIMTFLGKLGYWFRPIVPWIVDPIVRMKTD